MVLDVVHLKKIRKQIGLTQQQFAKETGISQSMVAKIESGKLDPTYSYVKKIDASITRLTKNEEKQAKDIMHVGIISISPKDTLLKVMALFTHKNISQVPVIDNNRVVGLISESNLVGLGEDEIKDKKISEVMSESPPIISDNASVSAVVQLLKFYPIVLVSVTGKLKGVVTKADVIKVLAAS